MNPLCEENVVNETESVTIPEDKILLEPHSYIRAITGKHVEWKLAEAFNYWLNIPPKKCEDICEMVQAIQHSTIITDDIEDNSTVIRGIPVAHNLYGIGSAMNAANYAGILSLGKAINLGHPKATSVFARNMIEFYTGRGIDIYWRDNFFCPSEEEYKKMIRQKKGGPFNLNIQLMQLFSNNQSDFSKICELIALYFQIQEDYTDLKSQEYIESKSQDLTKMKFSFPIIHAIKTHPEDQRIFNIVKRRKTEVMIKKYVARLLEELGSFEYTAQVLSSLEKKILEEIRVLGENAGMFEIIHELKNMRK